MRQPGSLDASPVTPQPLPDCSPSISTIHHATALPVMSAEQLKAFLAKAWDDADLQNKLNAVGADPVAIAAAAGFSITLEDYQRAKAAWKDWDLSRQGDLEI